MGGDPTSDRSTPWRAIWTQIWRQGERRLTLSSVLQLEEMHISLTTINPDMLILIVCLVLALRIALWMYRQKKQTQKLRSKFGPETPAK